MEIDTKLKSTKVFLLINGLKGCFKILNIVIIVNVMIDGIPFKMMADGVSMEPTVFAGNIASLLEPLILLVAYFFLYDIHFFL